MILRLERDHRTYFRSLTHTTDTQPTEPLHAPIPLSPSQVDSAQRGAPGSNDVDAQHLGDALAPDDGASHSLGPSPSDYLIPERRNNRGPTTGRSLPGYHTAAVCSGLSPLSIPERSS